MTRPAPPFGRETIESIIPHRPPFLLVDEVLELEPGRRVRRAQARAARTSGGFPATSPAGR